MNLRSLCVSLSFVLALGACSGSDPQATGGDTAAPAATTSAGGAATSAGADTAAAAETSAGSIHVTITGGAHAGTYDVAGTDGCSYNLAEKGAWGNQFSRDMEDPKQLSSVQMIVPDAQGAASGTDRFLVSVGFGPMLGGGTTYTVDTRGGAGGKGTVKVEDRTQTGTVTFDGTTADGVRLQGTIECGSVVRV